MQQEPDLMSLKVPIIYTIYYTTSVLDALPRFSPLANLPHSHCPIHCPTRNPLFTIVLTPAGVQREYLDGVLADRLRKLKGRELCTAREQPVWRA